MQRPRSDDHPGRFFDVVHDSQVGASPIGGNASGTPGNPRPFLGIQFRCCQTYGRIYRNDEQTAYRGSCPKCGGRVEVPIGSGGTSKRFFSAG